MANPKKKRGSKRSIQNQVTEEVSQEMNDVFKEYNEVSQGMIKEHFGKEVNHLLSVVEQASADPDFAGLKEVPDSFAQSIASSWQSYLKSMNDTGGYEGELPQGFICRMMEDGSLFLKAVSIPKGIVLCGQPATIQQAPAMRAATSQARPNVTANSMQPIGPDSHKASLLPKKPRKKLEVDPQGNIRVKRPA